MITIDKGVPVPERVQLGDIRYRKYPLNKLEVGDSFAAPSTSRKEDTAIRASAFSYGKKYGRVYRTRACEENGQRVIRVWRVE